MVTRFEHVSPKATAEDVGKLLLVTTQQEFPVLDDAGTPQGIVTREALIRALLDTGPATPVTDFMLTSVPRVASDTPLIEVMTRLTGSATRAVAVHGPGGRFLGYVSAENLADLLMLDEARGAFATATGH